VSDRRTTEGAERRLDAIERVSDGVVVLDFGRRYTHHNRSAAISLGTDRSHCVASTYGQNAKICRELRYRTRSSGHSIIDVFFSGDGIPVIGGDDEMLPPLSPL